MWINPKSNTILLVGDQGALVTVNGGKTWSVVQPAYRTAHVATSNRFRIVCGGQPGGGSVCVSSRGTTVKLRFATGIRLVY
jgi:photosystem II stability/assembly factor-like uncharacterized protein